MLTMMQPDHGKRHYIAEHAALRRIRQADVVKATGADKATVSRWFKETRMPGDDYLIIIAALFGVERADLFRPPQGDAPDEDVFANLANEKPMLSVVRRGGRRFFQRGGAGSRDYEFLPRSVPVRGRAAEDDAKSPPLVLSEDAEEWVDRPGHLAGVEALFALEVDTDELSPLFRRGQKILVHPGRALVIDEPCVVIDEQDRALLKIYKGRSKLGHMVNTLTTPTIVTIPEQPGVAVCKVLTYDDLIGG